MMRFQNRVLNLFSHLAEVAEGMVDHGEASRVHEVDAVEEL